MNKNITILTMYMCIIWIWQLLGVEHINTKNGEKPLSSVMVLAKYAKAPTDAKHTTLITPPTSQAKDLT